MLPPNKPSSPRPLVRQVNGYYLADSAVVLGDVTIGAGSSLWFFTCVRGDVAPIRIGQNCCIQDFSMLHCKSDVPLIIEDNVGVGHQALVHCTRVRAGSLIGSGARVLDDCMIGSGCIVAAGAVVVPGTIVPDGKVLAGVPAKVLRDVTDKDRAYLRHVIEGYQRLSAAHAAGKYPPIAPWPEPLGTT